MRARLKDLRQLITLILGRLQLGLGRILEVILRVWRRLNAVEIPLSPLQWILLFYIIFGFAYTAATPVFEANDELWHFGYLQFIRETGELPIQVFDGSDTVYAQHGSQPPLYYVLMALLTAPIDIHDADNYRMLNPHVTANQPDSFGNKNLVLRDNSVDFWRGTGLVVLIVRLGGLALGAGTIVLVFKVGEFVAPQRPTVAFVAAAITGLNPMFIFVSASINNDALAMILNGALVLTMLRCLRDGFSLRYSLLIALLFALTSITKLTSLVLLPILLGIGIFVYFRSRDLRGFLVYFGVMIFFWLILAGWWYLRNLYRYDEPFGMMTMANIAGPRGITFSIVDLLTEFQQFRMSFWGTFGALNIQLSAIFYLLLDLMTFFGLVGCVFLVLQLLAISDFAYARYELTHVMALLITFAFLWIGVLYWSTQTRTSDGRILFPLIAVISPILAVGFVETVWWIVFSLRPPNLDFVRAGDAVPRDLLDETMVWQLRILGIVAILAPITVIAGQYAAPEPVVELPKNARPVYAEFGDVALVAYERLDRRYSPGDKVRVKLYWRVMEQSEADNSIFLRLVDDKRQEIGHYLTFPGAGTLRTSAWQTGAIYPDEYLISIHASASGRYPFDLMVEWENLQQDHGIRATNAEGDKIGPVLLNIGAVVSTRLLDTTVGYVELPAEQQPNFDESIRLLRFALDSDLNELVLVWKTESLPDDSYSVFVHMLDDNGSIVAQADSSPRLPTKYWRWGETYSTHHRLPEALPLQEHKVLVGWYLNDGLTYPKTEYRHKVEQEEGEEEIFLDSYAIPWDILQEQTRLTEEASIVSEDEATPAALNQLDGTPSVVDTQEPGDAGGAFDDGVDA